MAKNWKPRKLSFPKMPTLEDLLKAEARKEAKQVKPHIITTYERKLIDALCPAIKDKKMIRFWYEDKSSQFSGWRNVEPHLIGQTSYKAEEIWLVGWFMPTPDQYFNFHEAKWGNYVLERISKLEILEELYGRTRPGYNSDDSRMKKIFCATVKNHFGN